MRRKAIPTKSAKKHLYLVDPNELPRYSVAEAARYLGLPKTTLRSWIAGRDYAVASGRKHWEALIPRPDSNDPRLSFSNLIEAHVLKALRQQFRVDMKQMRTALEYAGKKLEVKRVLLSKQLRATRGNVFLEHLGQLLNLGRGGQQAMPEILAAFLERVEWGPQGQPQRIFPQTRQNISIAPRIVAINPRIAFGRPVIARNGVTTAVIAERFGAGESLAQIVEDYDLQLAEVEEAIRYESQARAA